MANVVCPYCQKELEKTPSRKKRCPFCNNYMYVRTQPSNRQKVVVTEECAKQIDLEWARIGKINYRKQQLLEHGISEADFIKRIGKSIEEATDQEFNDLIIAELNRLTIELKKNKDFGTLKSLYYEMALLLNKQGQDWIPALREFNKMSLLDIEKHGVVKKVEIHGDEASCEACKQQHNRVFTIEEALEKMPLPCKECTFKMCTPGDELGGFCRCNYFAVFEDD